MQWFGKGSSNVEDGRGGGIGFVGGGIGVLLVVLGLLFGKDLTGLVSQLPADLGTQNEIKQGVPQDAEGRFVANVLESTEQVWDQVFEENGSVYEQPTLRLFTGSVHSGCGGATAAVGPFYCPADSKIYIDLSFYHDLQNRFGATGDFAQAYVIAHEVGHHIQNLMGTSAKIQRARETLSARDYNRLSVKLELQADFYAGVWAHHAKNLDLFRLDPGDIEEALNAASAIGDDKIQQQAEGKITPDAFTHGTSAQRMFWFKKGYETGNIKQGDTFNATL